MPKVTNKTIEVEIKSGHSIDQSDFPTELERSGVYVVNSNPTELHMG